MELRQGSAQAWQWIYYYMEFKVILSNFIVPNVDSGLLLFSTYFPRGIDS